jgi:ADP-heptose:LPS heptosyltransferase
MKKKILVIIGGRGIGDLIYHLPLLRSLYKTYNQKIIIFSNKVNQASQVFKNEIFYKKIFEFNNERFNLFRTIINIIEFRKKINKFNFDQIILTSNTKRLLIPVLLSNSRKKFIFGTGKIILNKDNSLDHLTVSKKIIKYTNDLKLKKSVKNFFLKMPNNQKKIQKLKKKIFLSIDSHHDQNNWPINNFIKIVTPLSVRHKIFVNFSPNKKYFLDFFPKKILRSKNVEFTYKKKISEIIKIINLCEIVIGNESGPVCLGSSLKKKIHAIYTPKHTQPESKIINKSNNYYNTYKLTSKKIIQKILNSIL